MEDIFIFPNVEEYSDYGNFEERTKDKVVIRGEQLLNYILDNKYVEFSGGAKAGKSALAKMIAIKLEKRGIHSILVDCKNRGSLFIKDFQKAEEHCVCEAYGRKKLQIYRQMLTSKKVIIIDNIDFIKSEKERGDIIQYLANFYDYIISFTNMSYELSLLRESMHKNDEFKIKHCVIKELGHKQRDLLYRKWYKLDDSAIACVDEEIEKKVKKATNTINTLKGNGYVPCIPPNIIILLQQLEFQPDNNQDKSNYGYMYSFLINKAILDMKKNSSIISDDIAFGILVYVARFMLKKRCRMIDYHEFGEVVAEYNKRFITDASKDIYLSEYEKVDLIECENEQVKFKYPYIHYYFTARYLADHISEQFVKDMVCEMANNLQDEECGDIMIFLCHLSKKEYLLESVLQSSKKILEDIEMFDFNKYKNININIDEFLQTDFIPEEGEEERRAEILERKDMYEEEHDKTIVSTSQNQVDDEKVQKGLDILDAAYKSIEVMGQILKNYPGSIDGTIKLDLLSEIHALGMRALTFSHMLLKNEIEKMCDTIQKAICEKILESPQSHDVAINKEEILNHIKSELLEVSQQMDNLFGLIAYSLIRRLSNSLGNEELKPLINYIKRDETLSYRLTKLSIYLNEFGVIQGDTIISCYESLMKEKSFFAAKLLKLFVYEHYFIFGSKDIRVRQKIWQKFGFGKKHERAILLNTQGH